MSLCIHCAAEIPEGSAFCTTCGKKQVTVYHHTFERNGMSEAAFIDEINRWFAANPRVANVKGQFGYRSVFGFPVNNYHLNRFTIEYEWFERPNINQYEVTVVSRFALYPIKSETALRDWKRSHQVFEVLKCAGGTHQRGKIIPILLGGYGAFNRTKLYLFTKYERTAA